MRSSLSTAITASFTWARSIAWTADSSAEHSGGKYVACPMIDLLRTDLLLPCDNGVDLRQQLFGQVGLVDYRGSLHGYLRFDVRVNITAGEDGFQLRLLLPHAFERFPAAKARQSQIEDDRRDLLFINLVQSDRFLAVVSDEDFVAVAFENHLHEPRLALLVVYE